MSEIKYNRLIYESTGSIEMSILTDVEYGRCTGQTTGEILKFLGHVITNPNQKHYLKEHISDYFRYGNSYKRLTFDWTRDKIHQLGLKGIQTDYNTHWFEFSPYGTVKVTYEIIN